MSRADATFFSATYIEVTEAGLVRASSLLRNYRAGAHPAALGFEVLLRIERPTHFLLLGSWSSENAYRAQSSNAAALDQQIAELLAAPSDTRLHTPLAVGSGAEAGLAVATHVDVVPQHKDEAVRELQRLADASRKHDGNVRFDVWQQTNRLNHFTVVEGWVHRRAFDTHVSAPETRAFRSALTVMTGALYDERLYSSLT